MLIRDLYATALITPASVARRLYVVSGYASAIFAKRHAEDLVAAGHYTEVNLIVGMPGRRNDHLAFVRLHQEFEGRFRGYYLQAAPPVHCKVYGWFDGDAGIAGFAGSANYTQYGFFADQQVNQLSQEDPNYIRTLFESLLVGCVYIPEAKIDEPERHFEQAIEGDVEPGGFRWDIPDVRVTNSFLVEDTGDVPQASGLNWGQREAMYRKPNGEIGYRKRAPNEAYLSLKGDSTKAGFLPGRAIRFTLITDDNQSFDCVRAQDGDKAIHTTDDNSILGRYLRHRFGVADGAKIEKSHLIAYGRTDFTIEKLDDETFLLDLSVKHKSGPVAGSGG